MDRVWSWRARILSDDAVSHCAKKETTKKFHRGHEDHRRSQSQQTKYDHWHPTTTIHNSSNKSAYRDDGKEEEGKKEAG